MLLKTRIIIGVSAAMVIVSAGFWLAAQFFDQRQQHRFFEEMTSTKDVFLKYILHGQKRQMAAQMRSLTRDRDTISAIATGTPEDIEDEVTPTFNRLNTSGIVDALFISGINGNSLFHTPEEFDPTGVRGLMSRTIKTRKAVFGTIISAKGRLSVVLAFPLFKSGKLIGGAAYSQGFNPIAAEYKTSDGAEVLITDLQGTSLLSTNGKFFNDIDTSRFKNMGNAEEIINSGDAYYDVLTLPIKNVDGQLIAKMFAVSDVTAAHNEQSQLYWTMQALLAGMIIAFLTGLTFWLRRQFKPMTRIINSLQELSKGNLEITFDKKERNDEIGVIIETVQVFRESLIETENMRKSQKVREQRAEEEKRAMMQKLANDFDANIGGIVETVSSASTELQATAQSMAGISEETSNQAAEASAASQQTSGNVQSVATATEEMTSTIGEISQQVAQASEASRQAVEEVGNTSQQMAALIETANKVGEVVDMISSIAEQTNLLALNATIESARAGEAGKGFAVVAGEVKQLASQTAKATGEISQQISDIQNASQRASGSMANVAEAIGRVDEISTAIAAAMEEQSAATQEIAASVNQAAAGTQQVNDNIASVTHASQEAGAASGEVMSAAGELSQQAELLKGEVDKFISQVRAG